MKKTPLSELASNWDKGQSFKKECIVDAGNTRCIHYGELFKYGPIIDTVLSSTNELPLKKSVKGDILFPASDVTPTGLARCSAIMCDDVLLGGDIIILRLNKGYLPEFVSYAINLQKEQLIRRVTGSVVRHMSAKGLRGVEIPTPTIEEQNTFVKLVRKADKSKFNGFKSRFIEMFGNPNSNPHCLPTGLVSDLFTLQMGKTPARDTARYWAKDGSGNKWISIADMSRYEYFTNDTEEYISEGAIQETGMKLIPKNTVIMSFKLTIGRVSVTSEPIYSNEAIVAFIPKAQDYSTRFLYFLVKYYDWLENAALAVKGKTLNKESIGKNRLIIPSRESQNEFAAFAEQADKSKYLN